MTITLDRLADQLDAQIHSHDDLTSVRLDVSTDAGASWQAVTFEAESEQYLDHQISTYLKNHKGLLVELNQEIPWGGLPKSFNLLVRALTTKPKAIVAELLPLQSLVYA